MEFLTPENFGRRKKMFTITGVAVEQHEGKPALVLRMVDRKGRPAAMKLNRQQYEDIASIHGRVKVAEDFFAAN